MARNYSKGEFVPKNPHKYVGKYPIIYRSSWELDYMNHLDTHPAIKRWASESIPIPYISPLDNRKHRYFPDFIVESIDTKGNIRKSVIEIKPDKERKPGQARNKNQRAYQDMIYMINEAKWAAAEKACQDNGYDFVVLTEKELYK